MDLYYFDKKHKLLQATPQSIAFLIKGEQDFYKGFGEEKKITREVMLKYLNKMNDRYPDF